MRTRTLTILASLVLILSALGAASAGLKIKTARIAGNTVATDSVIGAASPRIVMKTVIFKLAPAGSRSWRGTSHRAWDDYAALATGATGSVVNLTRYQLAQDVVMNRDYGDTAALGIPNQKRGAMTDSLTHQRYVQIRQGGQNGTDFGKFPCTFPHASAASYSAYAMFYFPFENYIPANSRIFSAKLMLMADLATSHITNKSGKDTLFAVLDTLATDNRWYNGPRTYTASTSFYRGQTAASWLSQVQRARGGSHANTAARGYPASGDTFAWNPPLADRSRKIDWGPSGLGISRIRNMVADSSYALDITRPIQYIADGSVNNGLWLLWRAPYRPTGAAQNAFGNFHTWNVDSTTADSTRVPWVVVQYAENQNYNGGPWGGKEVAFVFVTADNRMPSNDLWTDVFDAHGAKYTISVVDTFAGSSAIFGDWSDIVGWHNRGFEIASHSRWHFGNYGIASHSGSAAGNDSLLIDAMPNWLHREMAAASGARGDSAWYAAQRDVGKTMHLAQAQWNLRTLAACDSLGYIMTQGIVRTGTGCRGPGTGAAGNCTDSLGYSPWDTTVVDRAVRAFGINAPPGKKLNAMVLPYMWDDQDVFGLASAPMTPTQIDRAVRIMVDDCAVRYNWPLIINTHMTLTTPNRTTYPDSSGANASQIDALLTTLENCGNVRVMTLEQMARIWRARWREIDHPTPWGTNNVWETRLVAPRQVWGEARTPTLP